MSEKKKIIITIARQYGSGGADTGKKIGGRSGDQFYDKNILRMTQMRAVSKRAISIWQTRRRATGFYTRLSIH